MPDPDPHPAALRIHLALDSIQEALRLTARAAQALARTQGVSFQRRSLGSISNQLSQTWLAISACANRPRRRRHLQGD